MSKKYARRMRGTLLCPLAFCQFAVSRCRIEGAVSSAQKVTARFVQDDNNWR